MRIYFTFRNRRKGDAAPLRSAAGFTLIELMISIAIFVVVVGMVSTSYISIIRGQRQANEIRKMYSDVRVFLDTLGEEVRLGAIDYNCYNPLIEEQVAQASCPYSVSVGASIQQGKTDRLALVKGHEKTLIFLDTDNTLKMQKYVNQTGGWGAAQGYEVPQSLLSERLSVRHLSFAIFPDVNPYSNDPAIYADNATQFQPKVTVFFSVESAEGSSTPFSYDFQTTLSSRVYSRAS